jgi:hypothetical protein
MTSAATAGLRCRSITEGDLPAIAELLSRGFRLRSKQFWLRGLKRQADRPKPAGTPEFGFLLEHAGSPVGVVLLFYSWAPSEEGKVLRCNLSSWYVEPKYRSYGSLLISAAIKDKNVTYFNVSSAPNTWPIVEAQGFSMYCRGEMYALPALQRPVAKVTIEVVTETSGAAELPYRDLLRQHAKFGCLSLVLRCGSERYPFIFQRHRVKRVLPSYRLVYCRDMTDFVRFAGNLGRVLLRLGVAMVVVDANEAIPGLIGHYTQRRGRKYARGPYMPKLGDLAFSEGVFFNI